MIKNERQYRISKAQLLSFQEALANLNNTARPVGVDPRLVSAQREAMVCDVEELEANLSEYEALRDGKLVRFVADSFAEVPLVLIKARIAQGLTHKDLAARLQLKEQQVQRWESTDYSGASVDTLKQVIDVLGVECREEMFIPNRQLTPAKFLHNLVQAGVPQEFALSRLLPAPLSAALAETGGKAGFRDIFQAASIIGRIFSTSLGELLSLTPPTLDFGATATARYKLPARAKGTLVDAYTVYAHYLGALLVEAIVPRRSSTGLSDWRKVHAYLVADGGPPTFRKLLGFVWRMGIVVLPLRAAGAFHGAVWKISGTFVVVLKQGAEMESRWLYDLLHELGHIAHKHVSDDAAVVEAEPISPRCETDREEEEANGWAESALFNGEIEQLEEACVKACDGKMERLKVVLPDVAKRFNANLGSLANHMAYRLAAQGQNWWGAANNLQLQQENPFGVAREALLSKVNLHRLNPIDRSLLLRALTDD